MIIIKSEFLHGEQCFACSIEQNILVPATWLWNGLFADGHRYRVGISGGDRIPMGYCDDHHNARIVSGIHSTGSHTRI